MIMLSSVLRRVGLLWLGLALGSAAMAQATRPMSLWPTIPFIRGQDLCQFQDAYGKSRNELALEMAGRLKDLLSFGAEADDALDSLLAIDALIDKNRRLASSGQAMDLTLEASLRAALDGLYREIKPKDRKLTFLNPTPLLDMLRELRSAKARSTNSNWPKFQVLHGAPTPTGRVAAVICWSRCTSSWAVALRTAFRPRAGRSLS